LLHLPRDSRIPGKVQALQNSPVGAKQNTASLLQNLFFSFVLYAQARALGCSVTSPQGFDPDY
jgi:hypothetical protein